MHACSCGAIFAGDLGWNSSDSRWQSVTNVERRGKMERERRGDQKTERERKKERARERGEREKERKRREGGEEKRKRRERRREERG